MPERFNVTVDGESVAGVYHPAPGDRWLLFCHGFLSDKSGSYEGRCRRAVAEGYNAVRFDFRGCGDSDGAFVDQTLSDKIADLQAVVEHVGPDRYALFGSSFGGKVAFHTAATDDRVSVVATRAPVTYNRAFDDYRATVDRDGVVRFDDGRAIDSTFFADFETYDFETVTDRLDVPVAIFHGRADDSVPIDDSFDAASALSGDVLLEAFADEGHLFSEEAEQRLRELLFGWLDGHSG
ncbi:alpha/beta hydrolase family protein [Salinibaculum rarum]|uniref:alpha/beta hydrolase family protein n=1 Tax=Salinibaculum rarum TaxID=3058903 RepID=UPI00265F7909|nr:alpha/beta hydrolase [Salinibaculum sp. KK48]